MISFDAEDFNECRSKKMRFLLTLSVNWGSNKLKHSGKCLMLDLFFSHHRDEWFLQMQRQLLEQTEGHSNLTSDLVNESHGPDNRTEDAKGQTSSANLGSMGTQGCEAMSYSLERQE